MRKPEMMSALNIGEVVGGGRSLKIGILGKVNNFVSRLAHPGFENPTSRCQTLRTLPPGPGESANDKAPFIPITIRQRFLIKVFPIKYIIQIVPYLLGQICIFLWYSSDKICTFCGIGSNILPTLNQHYCFKSIHIDVVGN